MSSGVIQVDDASGSPSINFINSNWLMVNNTGWFNNTYHTCRPNLQDGTNCAVKITFTGTEIALFGNSFAGRGRYYCVVDDTVPWTWYNGSSTSGEKLGVKECGVSGLSNMQHTFTYGQTLSDYLENGITFDYYTLANSTSTAFGLTWSSDLPTMDAPADLANTTSTPSNASPTASPSSRTGSSSHAAAIGGGVGGGIGALMLLGLLFLFLKRRRGNNHTESTLGEIAFRYHSEKMPPWSKYSGSRVGTEPSPIETESPASFSYPSRNIPHPEIDRISESHTRARSLTSIRNGLEDPDSFRRRENGL